MSDTLPVYGTLTSPFVRRVRMVAHELGLPVMMHDTSTDEGKARLREVSPVWKVPAAIVDGTVLLDSGTIVDVLLASAAREVLRPLPTSIVQRALEQNFIHAIDEATLAAVHLFYSELDGIEVRGAWMEKQRARVGSILSHLDATIPGEFCTANAGFGRAELALLTGLDWMHFRKRVDLAAYPRLAAFHATHASRESFVATTPPT